MGEKWIPLISAGIGGLAAIIVMLINQIVSYIRWKEELKRKGEDKYLEKRLEYLHNAIVEFYELGIKAIELCALEKRALELGQLNNTQLNYFKKEIIALNTKVKNVLIKTLPYMDTKPQIEVELIINSLTQLEERVSVKSWYMDRDIEVFLHERFYPALTTLIKELNVTMRGNYVKKDSDWIKWIGILSIITNILLVVYIVFV